MANNVIELVFKLRDGVSTGLTNIKNNLKGFGSIGALAAGALGAVTVVAGIRKMITASQEAEAVLTRFDITFKNLGESSRKTRSDILKFADDMSRKSVFDDEKILEAQTALLKFRSVAGATFDRARKDTLNLAAALGTDLTTAANIVGRAIERPELAIRQLRAAGVIFTAEQEKMIKKLAETGQTAKASEVLLGELERRFDGASDKLANTLGGAIARTRTAFENLFEVDTGGLTAAINKIADTLNDPEVRRGIQVLITGLAEMVGLAVKLAAKTAEATKNILDASANFQARNSNGEFSLDFSPITAKGELRKELEGQIEKIRDLRDELAGLEARNKGRGVFSGNIARIKEEISLEEAYLKTLRQRIELLDESVRVRSRGGKNRRGGDRGVVDTGGIASATSELTDEMRKQGEALAAALDPLVKYNQTLTQADKLLAAGAINWDTWSKATHAARQELEAAQIAFGETNLQTRTMADSIAELTIEMGQLSDSLDHLSGTQQKLFHEGVRKRAEELQETLDKINAKIEVDLGEALEKVKEPFDEFIDTVVSALDRMLDNGKFTFRELGNYLLREVKAGLIKQALDALRDALKKAFEGAGNGKSSGFFNFIGNVLGSFGGSGTTRGKAGGGRGRGWEWVGEEGKELVNFGGGAQVYNGRTLAGLGLGSQVYIGGSQITVQGGDTSEKTIAAFRTEMAANNARLGRQMQRMIENNNRIRRSRGR